MKFWNLTIYPLPNEIGHFETLCDVENWLWIWENYFTWCEKKNTLLKLSKEWELEKILYWNLVKSGNLKKETKVNAEVLLIKSSGIIFFTCILLIMWIIKAYNKKMKPCVADLSPCSTISHDKVEQFSFWPILDPWKMKK